ncbi:hypothetical protein EMCRGX_G019086 [Ephydatia muelleri]
MDRGLYVESNTEASRSSGPSTSSGATAQPQTQSNGHPKEADTIDIPTFNPSATDSSNSATVLPLATRDQHNGRGTSRSPRGDPGTVSTPDPGLRVR